MSVSDMTLLSSWASHINFFLIIFFISHLYQQECNKLLHQSLMLQVSGIQAAQESHCTCAGHLIVPAVSGKGECGPLVAMF